MNVIAINGSPRKKWNTAKLLEQALSGAASEGASTELVHLYSLDFKGCISCFSCKQVGGKNEGRCAVKDEATPVFESIREKADVIILGSPIYFRSMTGEMHSFMERLLFAPFVYTNPQSANFPRKLRTGFIYTMNVTVETAEKAGLNDMFMITENYMRMVFGHSETFCAYDTCQMADYSKVVMEYLDPVHKLARLEQDFPEECKRAFEFGRRLAAGE